MKSARVAASTSIALASNSTWWPSLSPEPTNRSISVRRAGQGALDPLRADDGRGRRHDRVRRIAGGARRIGGGEDRISHQVDLGRHRDVEQRAVVRSGALVHQRQGEVGLQGLQRQVQHRVAVHRGDLRLRIHHRGAGAVLHVLARDDGADLPAQRRDLLGIGLGRGDRRQRELGRQGYALVIGEPWLEREAAARREVGLGAAGRHHRGQRRGNVGDVGHHRALLRDHRDSPA